jgi:hypothetical protein
MLLIALRVLAIWLVASISTSVPMGRMIRGKFDEE